MASQMVEVSRVSSIQKKGKAKRADPAAPAAMTLRDPTRSAKAPYAGMVTMAMAAAMNTPIKPTFRFKPRFVVM